MPRVAFLEATHAVIGHGPNESGVLCWLDNEFEAYQERNAFRKQGYTCDVVAAPHGKLSDAAKDRVHSLILERLSD